MSVFLFLAGQRPGIAADTRISVVPAEEAGMSAERLERVKVAMQRYVERGESPAWSP
jgi:hypothetical protein